MPARVATLCALCGLLAACSPSSPEAERPNVLLLVVDTLRADHLGSYGSPLPTSPRIDALAARSAVFERGIAASPTTVPSHASMMTSLPARQIGAGFLNAEGRFDAPETLASVFRGAGYTTGAFVSNFFLHRRFGFDRGFEVFDDELDSREKRRRVRERIAESTTRRALDWIARVGDRPFFAWVHYQDPHGPYDAPAPFAGRLELAPAPGSAPLPVLHENSGRDGIPAYQAIDGVRLPSEYRARYANEILYADHWIGELLAAVESHPSGRDVVVLLTADHGESFGEDGRWFVHGFASTPPLAHVPFILHAPGLPPGRHRDPVGHVDVMPTLLELAGIEPPSGMGGLALGPFLREGRPLPGRWLFCDLGQELSAYRDDGWVRIRGIRPGEGGTSHDDAEAVWERYRWADDGRWELVASDLPPDPELRAFVRTAVPVLPQDRNAEVVEQLRALGYLD